MTNSESRPASPAPSPTDRLVNVRAYLTDEHFGYDHWRAAQFSAPSDGPLALLVICTDEADRERVRSLLSVPVSPAEGAPLAALRTALTDKGTHPDYHDAVEAEVRRKWPALMRAVDGLLAAPSSEGASRPEQTNCQQEPPYPGAETVVASIRSPELTAHSPSAFCSIQEPHKIVECGEFEPRAMHARLIAASEGARDVDLNALLVALAHAAANHGALSVSQTFHPDRMAVSAGKQDAAATGIRQLVSALRSSLSAREAELATIHTALKATGVVGIFDEFNGPADAIAQFGLYAKQQSGGLEAARAELRHLTAGPAGPFQDCADCGRAMVWDGPNRNSWMCPRCVWQRMRTAESELTAARAELEEARRRLTEVEGLALRAVRYVGCGDNSCLFVPPSGAGTNGGCRCSRKAGVIESFALLFRAALPLDRSET